MFHVLVKLDKSSIHGIGLFAAQNIKKDQKVYTANSSLDLMLSEAELARLIEDEIRTIKHYGFFDRQKQKWHYAFDDIKFCNHSADGNVTSRDGSLVAKRAILEGEEITQDYNEFEKLRDKLTKI